MHEGCASLHKLFHIVDPGAHVRFKAPGALARRTVAECFGYMTIGHNNIIGHQKTSAHPSMGGVATDLDTALFLFPCELCFNSHSTA